MPEFKDEYDLKRGMRVREKRLCNNVKQGKMGKFGVVTPASRV